jgi:hypothetical protein
MLDYAPHEGCCTLGFLDGSIRPVAELIPSPIGGQLFGEKPDSQSMWHLQISD